MDEPPSFAMLNPTRLPYGTPQESQAQGLGIPPRWKQTSIPRLRMNVSDLLTTRKTLQRCLSAPFCAGTLGTNLVLKMLKALYSRIPRPTWIYEIRAVLVIFFAAAIALFALYTASGYALLSNLADDAFFFYRYAFNFAN